MKEREYTYLWAFIHITRAISSSLNLEEVLHLIVKNTCETTGAMGCALMLLDEKGETLNVESSYGLSDRYLRKGPVSADESISDTLKGKPVIIEDAGSDPSVQYPQEAREEGIASIASFPIVFKEKVIGVLRLYTSLRCLFSDEDIDFLSAIAMQGGIAIGHARMYESARGNIRGGEGAS